MGNYISCTMSAPTKKQTRAARVIFPSGETKQFHQPITAAEVMLETPNFLVVNTLSLHVGTRFSALQADEDLEMGNVYAMFPMTRLNSRVTAADMDLARRLHITPALPRSESTVPKLNLDDMDELEFSSAEFKLSLSGSKKPMLETIVEEPCSG